MWAAETALDSAFAFNAASAEPMWSASPHAPAGKPAQFGVENNVIAP
jgi:hypothetical protein